jgi:hypothetical protein
MGATLLLISRRGQVALAVQQLIGPILALAILPDWRQDLRHCLESWRTAP